MKIELPRYQSFQPTGWEWLPELPAEWEGLGLTRRIERIVDYRGATPEKVDDGTFLITAKNVRNGQIDYAISTEYVATEALETIMRRGKPRLGDLLLTMEAPLGEVANIDREDIALAQRLVKIRPKSKFFSPYFLKYWMMSVPFRQHIKTHGTGSIAVGIKASKLHLLRVVQPPRDVQDAIVTFLDRETAKIDRLMAVRQKQVERLQEQRTAVIHHAVTKGLDPHAKLKPSGVEWLGEIPEGWLTHRLRRTTSRETNGFWGDEPVGDETDIICIRVADFDRPRRRVKDGEKTLRSVPANKRATRLLRQGDLLLEKSGGGEQTPVGCVVLYEGDGSAITSNFVAKLSPLSNYDGKFLCYLHQALYDVRITMLSVKQTTGIQNLDSFWYLNELAPFPPKTEQQAIVAHIDREAATLDTMMAKYRSELDLLAEYRASLISHAVTGKIDVRGLVEPSPSDAP